VTAGGEEYTELSSFYVLQGKEELVSPCHYVWVCVCVIINKSGNTFDNYHPIKTYGTDVIRLSTPAFMTCVSPYRYLGDGWTSEPF
jgi:hypothetical protein